MTLSTISPGEGVPRTEAYVPKLFDSDDVITPDTDEIVDERGKHKIDRTGNKIASNTAYIKDAFASPDNWKPGEMVAAVFKLEDNKDLDAYNKLLARATKADPEVLICSTSEKFYNGNFIILVRYREVWYTSDIKQK